MFTSCLPRSAWVRGRILGRWQSGSFEHAAGDGWWLAAGEEPAGDGSGGGNAEDGDGEAAIVLYGVFMIVERTARTPLMHPNLLSRRPIAAGAFLIFIAAGVLIADLFPRFAVSAAPSRPQRFGDRRVLLARGLGPHDRSHRGRPPGRHRRHPSRCRRRPGPGRHRQRTSRRRAGRRKRRLLTRDACELGVTRPACRVLWRFDGGAHSDPRVAADVGELAGAAHHPERDLPAADRPVIGRALWRWRCRARLEACARRGRG